MPVGLYADVHVPGPVILQLRLRGVDIFAATEQGNFELPDDDLLELKRAMVTQDIRFRVRAEDWQREGRAFGGLVFAHQRFVSYGELVLDLQLIATATDSDYWRNRIEQLPL